MKMLHLIVAVAGVWVVGPVSAWGRTPAAPPDELLTVAEQSDYTATARYADVVALCERLDAASDLIHMTDMGTTVDGRSIPLLIVADPPVTTPDQAARSGKVVVLIIGNIHGGEVCGKEALPMLVREMIDTGEDNPMRALLKDVILAVAPIYNADGNERVGPIATRRPGQAGPDGGEGVGTRENAQGFDLNRDFVKLEAPETRGLVRFLRTWDPDVFIDTHTTNGSNHQYVITYMGPTSPVGDRPIIEFVRDRLLPEVGAAMEERAGYKSFFYGNLEGRDAEGNYSKWTTYPDLPRYGVPYVGLRNRLSILSEAYAYAPYKERVLATKEFCRGCLEYLAANKDEVKRLVKEADVAARKKEQIVLRSEATPFGEKRTALGYVEELKEGKLVATDEPREYSVELFNNFLPTASVGCAYAYLYPRTETKVTETLQMHGVEVEELREDVELDMEAYRIESVAKAKRPFQGHEMVDVKVSAERRTARVPAGTMVVRTAQKLGVLASYMLEPHAADGLTAWNFFDDHLSLGGEFPVTRLVSEQEMLTCDTRPLGEDREMGKRVTYERLYENRGGVNFSGSPLGGVRWEEDGEHYIVSRGRRQLRVHAPTGRAEEVTQERGAMIGTLAALATIGADRAASMGNASFLNTDAGKTGALFVYENDLYYAAMDGSGARRLTSTPEAEEDVSWSPDGKFVGFTREYDLYVVDVATGTERRLTTGGHETLRNGKNDWVYFEELYGRSWRAYWWSPDSRRIAFLQVDSSRVPVFPLPVDHAEPRRVEEERYPRPGDPNPSVKLGVVTAAGGDVRWADLAEYDEGSFLITNVGWLAPKVKPGEEGAESSTAYCCVQNRTQTWMDVLTVTASSGATRKLMREQTEAWVEPQGEPRMLKDGGFIWASERTGYRHLYLYEKNGTLRNAITRGEWEARSIAHVDEERGEVYFNGTERTWVGSNLYRVKLDGTGMTLLTGTPVGPVGEAPLGAAADAVGSHSINFSPSGAYYIDTWSDARTPTRVALYSRDGALVRTLDTNPVYALEEYERGELERHTITMSDGFQLEATVLKPPGFSEGNTYPVWLMTYAGPHAPTVSDTWGGGRTYDEMLAEMGIVVFRVDPRSASGKGAVSAWTAYKQLGVQELKDLEEAVAWLAKNPWIDARRVGIAGGSYGGFMTCYALTHGKAFSAGIATASVTDWRDYDSIYTERYMLTPQENPEGYDKSSPVKGANGLSGRLLLIHGTMDDNVHMSNSIKLISALQREEKQFDFMLYPGARHGVGGGHVRRMSYDFIRREMLE